MSYLLQTLHSKSQVDDVIRKTEDLVLVLRFGKDKDSSCLRLDDIVSLLHKKNVKEWKNSQFDLVFFNGFSKGPFIYELNWNF